MNDVQQFDRLRLLAPLNGWPEGTLVTVTSLIPSYGKLVVAAKRRSAILYYFDEGTTWELAG